MPINVELLARTCEVPGAPGFEQNVRDLVREEIGSIADEMFTDNMGNLFAVKKGRTNDKKVMAAGHMDEIGFMVKYIDDEGFIRFQTLGGFDPKTLTAQRVIIHGKEDVIGVMSSKPIHIMTPEERSKPPKITDYFIDLGMKKEDVEKIVSIGDPITRERKMIEMGSCVNCKSIDNRVAVFILMEVIKELKDREIPYDFYAAFTVQEEVGLRGAHVAGHHVSPDFSFGLDTTIAYDLPGSQPEERVTKLGEGTGIKLMDASAICDYRMVAYMKDVAAKNNIKWQPEILHAGGTDTGGLQRMSTYGTIAGAVSVPTRHLHQVIEMANKDDIRASIDMLKESVATIDQWDWSLK